MGWRDLLGMSAAPVVPNAVIVGEASKFRFRREWRCGCGAGLKLRSSTDHAEGGSNFVPYPDGHKLAGHSQCPVAFLTWAGLAEERGWRVTPTETQCPACVRGLPLAEYKRIRRDLLALLASRDVAATLKDARILGPLDAAITDLRRRLSP